jgi:hypothetical protein
MAIELSPPFWHIASLNIEVKRK